MLPELRETVPEERLTVPEPRETVPEERLTVPELRDTVPEERLTVPELRDTVPEERLTVPELRDTVPEERLTDLSPETELREAVELRETPDTFLDTAEPEALLDRDTVELREPKEPVEFLEP